MENERNDRPMHKKARRKVCHFCVDRVESIDYRGLYPDPQIYRQKR